MLRGMGRHIDLHSALQARQRVLEASGTAEGSSGSETSSDEEELDEVETLLREEQLRQQYRQLIAAAKDQQYTPAFLRQFVEAEAAKSSAVTGLSTVRSCCQFELHCDCQTHHSRYCVLCAYPPVTALELKM